MSSFSALSLLVYLLFSILLLVLCPSGAHNSILCRELGLHVSCAHCGPSAWQQPSYISSPVAEDLGRGDPAISIRELTTERSSQSLPEG